MADLERPEEYEVVEPATHGGAPPRDEDMTPAQLLASRYYRSDYERMRLRDQLSFERQRIGTSDNDGPSLPPAPESEDYHTRLETVRQIQRREREHFQLQEARRRQELRRMARRRTAPTPPYVEGELSYTARPNRPEIGERRTLQEALASRRSTTEWETISSGIPGDVSTSPRTTPQIPSNFD
jgi:hypothetical protein